MITRNTLTKHVNSILLKGLLSNLLIICSTSCCGSKQEARITIKLKHTVLISDDGKQNLCCEQF